MSVLRKMIRTRKGAGLKTESLRAEEQWNVAVVAQFEAKLTLAKAAYERFLAK